MIVAPPLPLSPLLYISERSRPDKEKLRKEEGGVGGEEEEEGGREEGGRTRGPVHKLFFFAVLDPWRQPKEGEKVQNMARYTPTQQQMKSEGGREEGGGRMHIEY